ncbi:GNAT family N-acetyltransferase [Virgibacillus salinus]|uniref:Predicted acetyltransferase n=1 Tax=Virgibacillus salinus TaxID=553311 RepID=A0A1H1GML1_9BACI|nr:GNAT family N-acetyltransferase [Virgibacillus salinus]SDR14420.1 Predicted acetyltransferase [Virgibacillus salinus]
MNKIKTLTDKDFDKIFLLSQYAFQYDLSEEALLKKQEEAKRHTIWGWMEDDQLVAKLHLIPLSCYINGKAFEMGGISSIATWPEYRRQGSVKHLLHHALKHMKEQGEVVSFLHPFSFSFYRKYGWEHIFSEKKYTIPLENLKRKWGADGYIQRVDSEISILHKVYTEYAKQFNGTLVRDEKWWEQRVLKGDWHKAIAYDGNDQAEGYIIYKVKEEKVTVHELVYNSLNAQKLLIQFMANHDSMADTVEMVVPENDNLPLLIDEPRFDQKTEPFFMARIVDVLEFLKQYAFHDGGEQSLSLHVVDSFLPENSGVYQLRQIGSETAVNHLFYGDQGDHEGIHCTIQYLTSMLLGYKRPMELYHLGLVRGNYEQIEQLDSIIPKQQTFFPDFF